MAQISVFLVVESSASFPHVNVLFLARIKNLKNFRACISCSCRAVSHMTPTSCVFKAPVTQLLCVPVIKTLVLRMRTCLRDHLPVPTFLLSRSAS